MTCGRAYPRRLSPLVKRPERRQSRGMAKPKLGSGGRFKALKAKLGKEKGVSDPGALAASIGRKKYGAGKMSSMAAKGKKTGY